MHAARKTDAAPGHALPRNVAVQGLEVSLRHVLQDLLLQRQFGHQSPQTTVLLLQLLHPPCLFQLQSAVFLAPAIIGLFSYARFSAGLPGGLVVGYFDFDLPQDRDDLLSTMFFPRHAPASSRTSFSNISPGTKFAGQVIRSLAQLCRIVQSAFQSCPNLRRDLRDSVPGRWQRARRAVVSWHGLSQALHRGTTGAVGELCAVLVST